MAAFGTLTLLIALVVATYGGVASLVGARRGNQRLIASGRAATYALAAVLGLASVAMVYAFVSHDYSIKYVQRYSDASSPLFYQITAYWGGLDGSLLWWAFLLSVFGAIAVHTNRHRQREILPYAITVLMGVSVFFLSLIVFEKNPFDTFMGDAPATGNGLNPLLQNPYMITHPPALYTGFVGMTIPFAFAMGALISGNLDDGWLQAVRRWTIIAWFFLSMGLTLGMLWAYEELGWGGFWGWDPVENAGFLPWLTATAFLHSIQIQERRGMMKVWNFTLIILTFFLTIFGTFMTRSGIVQSVHAFGQDTELAWIFTGFMAFLLIFSFGFLVKRLRHLRARNNLDSYLSREGAFLLNNWILILAAFFVLFATMFPTLSEGLGGERITVGPPFFNKWMVPIGLVLLFLTGLGPLLPWRKASAGHLRYQFMWPVTAAAVTLIASVALGFAAADAPYAGAVAASSMGPTGSLLGDLDETWAALICFALSALVLGTIVQEYVRATSVRRRNTGSDFFTSALGLTLRNRRRYGGYIVHAGIVCMFLGWAGQAYQLEESALMKPGESKPFGRYTLVFDELRFEEDRQKEMVTGAFSIYAKGQKIDELFPAIWYYANQNSDRTTEVAIRRTPREDLYITLGNFDLADNVGSFKLVVNPLVNWIWFGFMMLAFGTGIALLPERAFAPALARARTGAHAGQAATALALLLAGLISVAAPVAHAAPTAAQIEEDMRWLQKNLMCMCGCRHQLGDCGGECSYAPGERDLIRKMLQDGKTREDVVAFFVEKYPGQSALAAPLDEGINRLAWAFPYAVGMGGALAIGLSAWRFSRKKEAAPLAQPEPSNTADPDLEDKLDEELDRID